jgi:gluconolactonase
VTTLSDILETPKTEKLADGFVFTEGPLWHPDGLWYFVDVRDSKLYRLAPGQKPELVRQTVGGNGTTFDMRGRLINCEGDARRLTVTAADGTVSTLIDHHEGKRLNRVNDVICRSDGTLFFTDPALRVPVGERGAGEGAVYRIAPDGTSHLVAWCEYPNGLALSPDEGTLYVSNTRWTAYIHAIEIDTAGDMVRRRIFADMSSDVKQGVPDGMKVDAAGRVFCTGPSGVWVFEPDGRRIGIIETQEVTANLAFGGPDLRTMLLTSSTSVQTLRVRTPGLPVPWYNAAGRSRV